MSRRHDRENFYTIVNFENLNNYTKGYLMDNPDKPQILEDLLEQRHFINKFQEMPTIVFYETTDYQSKLSDVFTMDEDCVIAKEYDRDNYIFYFIHNTYFKTLTMIVFFK